MVRLKDIAKECNLSVSQVSRALNGYSDVNAETKKQVQEVALKLGYVKNINAQILATNSSNQIAIIINGIDDYQNTEPTIALDLMRGVNKYSKQIGYETVVYLNEDTALSYLNFCMQRGLMGVILYGADYERNNFKEIIASDFPCVVIDIPIEGKNKGCVIVNNIYYSTQAVKQMLGKGKRNIAMLSGHGLSIVEEERRIGYEMALKSAGRKVRSEWIVKAGFDLEKARIATLALLKEYPEIDAIFCANDQMALGAIDALNSLNKTIPGDVSIFGFDGIVLTKYSTPPLSTIKQDNLQKGYSAAKLLCNILKGNESEQTIVVPCEMIIRESSAS